MTATARRTGNQLELSRGLNTTGTRVTKTLNAVLDSNGTPYFNLTVGENSYDYTLPTNSGTLALESYVQANPSTTAATLSSITIGNTSYSIQSGVTDVQINGTSILSDTIANFTTKTAYNASTNKIVTESDLTQVKRYI